MAQHVCPWWLGYFLVSPLRRLWEHPARMLGPFVREGMLVLEPGCGMGFFTLELARIVGPGGRVVTVDVQERMLAGLRRRARRAGLAERIDARLAQPKSLGVADLAGRVDVAIAVHVVHEVPDAAAFFAEIASALKPGGTLLVVEPRGHVGVAAFEASVALAERTGLRFVAHPTIGRDRAALLARSDRSPAARGAAAP